jgi:hypothetical protein
MNSGYFRTDEDGHWYHIPEQLVEIFDWATSSQEHETKVFRPEIFNLKGYDPISMTAEEVLNNFEFYRINGSPEHYKTVIFIPGE